MVDTSPSPLFLANAPTIATLPSLSISDSEQQIATYLAQRLFSTRPFLELTGYYYDGLQKMQDLGISIPPQLKGLRTVVGWPGIGIDALVNRCVVEGFRYPSATDVDDDLMGIWQANDLDGEAPLAILDTFVYGRAYSIVGAGDESTAGEPLITFESPLNMIGAFDARLKRVTSAFQIYLDTNFTSDMFGHEVAVLYLPEQTIYMARQPGDGYTPATNGWQITNRDQHNLGYVPVARLANRQRLADRAGKSEIRASWMNTVDSACRTLLGMEVTREFYAAPRRYALGVTEEAFQNSDGTAKSAWDAYLHKVWMLERDEEGQLPTIGEFKASDPSVHTKMLDTYSQVMAGEMGLPPHMLGLTPDANPASADAIRAGYEETTARARIKHVALSSGLEDTMRLGMLVKYGSLNPAAMRLEADWRDPAPQTLSGTSDALFKQISSGMVPATSDVTLKKAGYSAVERKRLAQDRLVDSTEQFLNEVAHSLTAKDVKVDKSLVGVLGAPQLTPTAPVPAPTPADVARAVAARKSA